MDDGVCPKGDPVRESSEQEFAEFFTATWPRLFRTAYALTGDVGAAEDALQSAFAKAYSAWPRVSSADHPEAYVRRMAVNEVLGVRRRAWWKAERSGPVPEPRRQRDPEADLLGRAEMWAALGTLPPRQRAVLVLRYYEDLSEQEIASVLGCSRGSVKSQASDGLSALRRRHAAGALVAEGGVA
jgi:RNA polymerase sigma-70 factor (sigma-E family)